MKNIQKLLALVLVVVMVAAMFAGCNGDTTTTTTQKPATPGDTTAEKTEPGKDTTPVTNENPDTTAETEPETTEAPVDPNAYYPTAGQQVASKEYGKDYTSLYEKFGKEITIADVEEDPDTGLAYLNAPDGKQYELGLDFLTMAMVYNTTNEGTSFADEDSVYAEWWKYYITRWNYLLPEIPLYSNEYYDVYNAKIKGVDTHPTNPYWDPSSALIDWTSEKDEHNIILGSTTDLSGKFRWPAFGSSGQGASDANIFTLTNGLELTSSTKEGNYIVNPTAVKSFDIAENDDGTATVTITLQEDLVFSDGSPITAKNYLYRPLVFSTPVGTEAAARDHKSLLNYVGFEDFAAYDGTEGTGSKTFSGIRLLGDYQFSMTVKDENYPYYYITALFNMYPAYQALWCGDCDIADDGDGVYFTDDFYKKSGDHYVMADHIAESSLNTDTKYPYSGPYMVEKYDGTDKSAVLKINPNFKGNYEGAKPSIESVVYKKVVNETQLEDLRSGGVDVLSGITGGKYTEEAIAMADASNGGFVYTHYSRAGYGKLGFRADYGPAQFTEVRQAIAYCMDRATFAKTFTGGFGGVVDGPYYTGSWMYKAAMDQGMLLNTYDTSVDTAIEILEKGGWKYDAEGNDYVSGIRYKKIPAEYATENDINYKSVDGAYKTTKVGDDYYMPLVLNWFGTVDNDFSDLLVTGFETNDNINNAGMKVYKNLGDFAPMLDELYQQAVYGFYSGSPMYCVFNFATSFSSAVYDYAYGMTIDPGMYDDMSQYYLKDAADIYWMN